MDTGRLSQGQLIAAISGVVLVISLFLKWIGPDIDLPEGVPESAVEGVAGAADLSGWEYNNALDVFLLILAAFAILPAAMTLAGSAEELPLVNNAATFLLGILGTVMMAAVVIDPGEALEKKFGLWLALLAVIGVTVGSYLSMQDEVGAEY